MPRDRIPWDSRRFPRCPQAVVAVRRDRSSRPRIFHHDSPKSPSGEAGILPKPACSVPFGKRGSNLSLELFKIAVVEKRPGLEALIAMPLFRIRVRIRGTEVAHVSTTSGISIWAESLALPRVRMAALFHIPSPSAANRAKLPYFTVRDPEFQRHSFYVQAKIRSIIDLPQPKDRI